MKLRLFGGILLILGTCIGAGLLALPIATAQEGFLTTLAMLVAVWLAMTMSAFLLLEVNLWFPENSNLISMAKATIGKRGAALTWIAYLLLLYALLCAYVASNSDIFGKLLTGIHLEIPSWLSAILVVLLLGYIVFRGIYSVDIFNRGLMTTKLIIYTLLILAIAPHAKISSLMTGNTKIFISGLMVIATSFGYAIILPSLRTYFNSNVIMLRRAIFFGSLIPLIFYILWVAVVHGALPMYGQYGLMTLLNSAHPTTELASGLSVVVTNFWVVSLVHLFVSICAVTSFLGVSLSLSDFLADGLQVKKQGKGAVMIALATFFPPLVIILFFPGAFIAALSYAGIFCVFILMLLPAWMAWGGRYCTNVAREGYSTRINKLGLGLVIGVGVLLIGWSLLDVLTRLIF